MRRADAGARRVAVVAQAGRGTKESRWRRLAAWAAAALAWGCGRQDPAPPAEATLTVYAAASLREVFTALAGQFERDHPGVTVALQFAGSHELRTQLEHGARADVFASADQRHVEALVRAGLLVDPVVFAHNEPVIVVASDSTARVREVADLVQVERLVLGAAEAPIGRYADQVLDHAAAVIGGDFRAKVDARVVSREPNVRQVLTKVALGEAQAGVVYRSDARAAGDRVGVVAIPTAWNVVAAYPIGVVAGARSPALARAWVAHVCGPAGRSALAAAGWTPVSDAR